MFGCVCFLLTSDVNFRAHITRGGVHSALATHTHNRLTGLSVCYLAGALDRTSADRPGTTMRTAEAFTMGETVAMVAQGLIDRENRSFRLFCGKVSAW